MLVMLAGRRPEHARRAWSVLAWAESSGAGARGATPLICSSISGGGNSWSTSFHSVPDGQACAAHCSGSAGAAASCATADPIGTQCHRTWNDVSSALCGSAPGAGRGPVIRRRGAARPPPEPLVASCSAAAAARTSCSGGGAGAACTAFQHAGAAPRAHMSATVRQPVVFANRQRHQHQQQHAAQQQTLHHHRHYHVWYYGSKLRNRALAAVDSLDQLEEVLKREGGRMDHINLALYLQRLRLAAGAARAAAVEAPPLQPPASAAAPAPSAPTGSSSGAAAAAMAAAVKAAGERAVEVQATALAAHAARLVRRKAKWYDPRHAALVVVRTAALPYTDGRLLHDLTGRVVARLSEAYSKDLTLLLRGLYAHARLSAAAAAAAAAVPTAAAAAAAAAAPSGADAAGAAAAALPYSGPPPALLHGVRAFVAAKLPTGRMPPENADGLLRYLRVLGGGPLGPALCAAAAEDLRRRMRIYAPAPLAGLLATLAAEQHALPPRLLDAAAAQFAAHADARGSGAAAARMLAAAAAHARLQQGAAAGGGAGSGGAWLAARPALTAACLRLMARDAPAAPGARVARWVELAAAAELPLASLAASAATGLAIDSAAAAAAASAFVRAAGEALERAAASRQLPASTAARVRASYGALALPPPKGL